MATYARFIYSQLFVTLPVPAGSHAGQTVIVTGSNTGLGKEASRHFVRLGASTVILAVRSLDKGNAAKADIESTMDREPGSETVQVWELNMASYASVKAFAKRVEDELPRVDIVIENAGTFVRRFARAEEGESTITVNVVSTFLLAALLLPKLRRTAEEFGVRPTLTLVNSEVHAWAAFKERQSPDGKIFETLNDEARWDKFWFDRYMTSKLVGVLAIQALEDRYGSGTDLATVNFVNPGLCHSGLRRDFDFSALRLAERPFARTTEEGSRTLVHAGSQGADTHWKYLSDCRVTPTAGMAAGKKAKKLQDRVWTELSQKLEDIQPGCTQNFAMDSRA